MFARTLQRQGFWKARNVENESGRRIFLKHDLYLGGIYVEVMNRVAVLRITELGIVRVFKRAKALRTFLAELEGMKGRIAVESPSLHSLVQLSSD
jgi:hypothetical protein